MALAIPGSWVVEFEEKLDEVLVFHFCAVVEDVGHFDVVSVALAYLLISWILGAFRVVRHESDRGSQNRTWVSFGKIGGEKLLRAPVAAGSESCELLFAFLVLPVLWWVLALVDGLADQEDLRDRNPVFSLGGSFLIAGV